MINDLTHKSVQKHEDARGFFAELIKEGEPTFHEIKQTSYSETHPGVVKGFHIHDTYWEMWVVIKGTARLVFYDARKNSSTFGEQYECQVSGSVLEAYAIPPGVAHGYQSLGDTPMGILYHAGKAYDPARPPIEHIPYDDPMINFPW